MTTPRALGLCTLAFVIACSSPPESAPPVLETPSPSPSISPTLSPTLSPTPTPTPTSPTPTPSDHVLAAHASSEPVLDGRLDEPVWTSALPVSIDHDWAGAPFDGLETTALLAWTESALFLAFDGTYVGEIDAPDAPSDLEQDHLYGHDALEAFLDPDPATPDTYRELELGPRGHFLDVTVDRAARPRGDVLWSSHLTVAVHVDEAAHRFAIEARVPAEALFDHPLAPSELRIGLFRIGRVGDRRCFLARFPTGTPRPNFHVPDRFGVLELRR